MAKSQSIKPNRKDIDSQLGSAVKKKKQDYLDNIPILPVALSAISIPPNQKIESKETR